MRISRPRKNVDQVLTRIWNDKSPAFRSALKSLILLIFLVAGTCIANCFAISKSDYPALPRSSKPESCAQQSLNFVPCSAEPNPPRRSSAYIRTSRHHHRPSSDTFPASWNGPEPSTISSRLLPCAGQREAADHLFDFIELGPSTGCSGRSRNPLGNPVEIVSDRRMNRMQNKSPITRGQSGRDPTIPHRYRGHRVASAACS